MKLKIALIAATLIPALVPVRSETMKAIVAHEYGGPDVLKYEDAPRPEPKDDQILVRVVAAGVNPVDGMILSGMFTKNKKLTSPMIPGGDIAGVVEKTGSKVTKLKKGDAIYAYLSLKNNGGYAALNIGDSSYGKFDKRIYTDLCSDHPIDLTRYQVANCYMGRAGLISSGGASGANDFEEAVATAVINKRAGGTGLISGRKAFQRPMKEGVQLLNTIQDVYLSPEVTIA